MEETNNFKYYVYKTTNIINSKIYIGVHKSEDIENDTYLGSGYILAKAIKHHGKDNFKREILFEFNTDEEAFTKEKEIVNEDFVARRDTYNTALGGHGGKLTEINPFFGKTHTQETIAKIQESRAWYKPTQETKEKISKTLLEKYENMTYEEICDLLKVKFGEDNYFYGKHHTQETIDKILESRAWYKPTQETKDLWSRQRKGIPKSDEHKQKIREAMTGRDCPWLQEVNRDPEKIRKTAEKHTGMKRSEEACKNISESLKGKFKAEESNSFKGYWNTPFGKFPSLELAAEASNNGLICIRDRCLKNERVVTKCSVVRDKNISETDIGKTWKDLGWFFESVINNRINKNKVEDI